MSANPYVQAWREWDERYADFVIGKRNWQIAAGGLLLATTILAAGMVLLSYRTRYDPSAPSPVISSYIVPIAPGATTQWMTHPMPGNIYVLEGTLTVEFADDRSRKDFKAGQAFLQAKTKWHRGRNDGKVPIRFLAVFRGAKDVPNVLHPPQI